MKMDKLLKESESIFNDLNLIFKHLNKIVLNKLESD